MRVAWWLLAALVVSACGGKAVIDGEVSGSGGSGSGGSGGDVLAGGGGVGGGEGGARVCPPESSAIRLGGDGPDQLYQAAGPDPNRTIAAGWLIVAAETRTTVRGCASNSSTNSCIVFNAVDLDFSGASSNQARVEYTSPQGIVFVTDTGAVTLDSFGEVGATLEGSFEAEVAASGGADTRSLFGAFSVCRSADVFSP